MKEISLEQLLMASTPKGSNNDWFVEKVMVSLKDSQSSIPSRITRTINHPRRKLLNMLCNVPKLAAILLGLLGIFAVSGTAFAVYTLWPKPEVQTNSIHQNQFGRTQIIASLHECGGEPDTSTYEIKKGSTLSSNEVKTILQAKCEMDDISKWATNSGIMPKEDWTKTPKLPVLGAQEVYTILSPVASKVSAITNSQLSLTGDQYNSPKDSLTLSPDTKYIVNGDEARQGDIHTGDAVLYIQRTTEKWMQNPNDENRLVSQVVKKDTLYVIKVDLPFEYYGPTKQNMIIQRKPCIGNEQDSCLQGGSIDLYENLAVLQSRTPADVSANPLREIQAIIQSYSGTSVTAKSSSGRVFTFTLPSNIIAQFNTTRSSSYNDIQIGAGDMIDVRYFEPASEHSLQPAQNNLESVNLVIDFIYKSDPIKKY